MRKIFLFILTCTCLVCLNSCRRDRIDHMTEDSIYVWEYDLRGDSTLVRYSQPIEYIGKVTKRHSWTTSHWVSHGPKRGGHRVTRHHYKVYYMHSGNLEEWYGYDVYSKVKEGDEIVIRETFYPRHYKEVIKVIH